MAMPSENDSALVLSPVGRTDFSLGYTLPRSCPLTLVNSFLRQNISPITAGCATSVSTLQPVSVSIPWKRGQLS